MVSLCCHAPQQFEYGTWWRCRECGAWSSVRPLGSNGVKEERGYFRPPYFQVNVYPAREHVSGLTSYRRDSEQVPLL